MKNAMWGMVVLLALSACGEKETTKVTCGEGTMAVAVDAGSTPDPNLKYDENNRRYVDGQGKMYKEIKCQLATPVTACGAGLVPINATQDDTVHPDGGGS